MHEAVVNYEMGESSVCTYMGSPLLYVPVVATWLAGQVVGGWTLSAGELRLYVHR